MRACVIACVPVATVVLLGLRCSLLWPPACTAIGCEHCLRHVLKRNCGHCCNLWWPLLSPLARCEPDRGHGGRNCGHCWSAWWPLLSPLAECQHRPLERMPQLWPLLDCRVATVECSGSMRPPAVAEGVGTRVTVDGLCGRCLAAANTACLRACMRAGSVSVEQVPAASSLFSR